MVYNRGMSTRKHHEPKTASTPATSQLTAAGIDFQVLEYEHDPDHMDQGYGIEAAARLGIDPKHVYKTLMADLGHERVIAVVPVDGHLDLKALAASVGAKKAVMADPATAQRESGYVLGGISPFGQRTRHRTVLDAGALDADRIVVSGGKRGFDVSVKPQDLIAVLDAVTAPLSTW